MNADGDKHAWAKELQRNVLLYPDSAVVALLSRAYPGRKLPKASEALDIGFGSGRHLKLLLDFGFLSHGIELIEQAVLDTRTKLEEYPGLGRLDVADISDHPFASGSLECVVNWGAAFLRPMDAMREDLSVVHDMLRSGGSLVVNFRTPENWFSNLGERVDQASVVLDSRAGPYEGETYTFLDLETATELLHDAGFDVAETERLDRFTGPDLRQHSWWLFTATK